MSKLLYSGHIDDLVEYPIHSYYDIVSILLKQKELKELPTNCVNCGAQLGKIKLIDCNIVVGCICEYCGTRYERGVL